MATKQTKSPVFAVLPFRRGGLQDIFFYWVLKVHEEGELAGEVLQEKYMRPKFGVGDRDSIIELLSKAGITVRYYDPAEKRWMDQSESAGMNATVGDRDGGWVQPDIHTFKLDYLKVRFGASAVA